MKFLLLSLSIILLLVLYSGCSSSKKFTEEESRNYELTDNSSPIRILVDEQKNMYTYNVDSPIELKVENKSIGVINSGVNLVFKADGNKVSVSVKDKNYHATYFQVIPVEDEKTVNLKGKNYKGSLRIAPFSGNIQVINTLKLEEYLRGVIPSEMPLGKGNDNFEALKAFAICARTYAFSHMNSSGNYDLHNDTRDQVYNGTNIEKSISTKALYETRGMLLTYNNKPAVIFYHSTCGGYTEDAENVFSVKDVPYLQSIKDGDPSNCSISPKYEWKESYTNQEFTSRIRTAGLLSGPSWTLKNAEVKSRFTSGRVKELLLTFSDSSKDKTVTLNGNSMRAVIRNSENTSILNSNYFDISLDDKGNVTLKGKGYGHGVGLCQFGAIYLSRSGKSYTQILSHYYPGTSITKYYD